MPNHEYFEELAALGAIGQLSREECREFVEHARACAACRSTAGDFTSILEHLPLLEPNSDERNLRALESADYRERFLERASAAGVSFTPEGLGRKGQRPQRFFFRNWRPIFAGASLATAVLVISITTGWLNVHYWIVQRIHGISAANSRSAKVPAQNPNTVLVEAAATRSQYQNPAAEPGVIARLQTETRSAEERLARLQQERTSALEENRRLREAAHASEQHEAQLAQDNQQSHQQLADTKTSLEKITNQRDSMAADLVADAGRIKDLSQEVDSQKAAVERERELTAAAKDIREFMGARNLHMIDVADVDSNGKSKKSFGRVFFAEGKSLLFYAFDLGQKGNASKVSFQAWGAREGQELQAKNLGVFFVDDSVQKRWVLKVDDPEKLKAIDSVFVTIEPLGGGLRPTGKKLLYAYLGVQANHP